MLRQELQKISAFYVEKEEELEVRVPVAVSSAAHTPCGKLDRRGPTELYYVQVLQLYGPQAQALRRESAYRWPSPCV